MADNPERIPISWTYDPSSGEIRRIKGPADAPIENLVVAKYNADKKIVSFASLAKLRTHKIGVITYLVENEMEFRSILREDLKLKDPKGPIPERPKKNRHEGDKTPEVVEWYFRYKPAEFYARYGVIGKYTGRVTWLRPNIVPRPQDGEPENRGSIRVEEHVEDVFVATRAVAIKSGGMDQFGKPNLRRLTFTPEECEDFTDQEEENEFQEADQDEGQEAAVSRKGREVE